MRSEGIVPPCSRSKHLSVLEDLGIWAVDSSGCTAVSAVAEKTHMAAILACHLPAPEKVPTEQTTMKKTNAIIRRFYAG